MEELAAWVCTTLTDYFSNLQVIQLWGEIFFDTSQPFA